LANNRGQGIIAAAVQNCWGKFIMAESTDSPGGSGAAGTTTGGAGKSQVERSRRSPDDPLFAHIVYGVYLVSFSAEFVVLSFLGFDFIFLFVFLFSIAGLTLANFKRKTTYGNLTGTHYTWQIRTFWYSLPIAVITVLPFIGNSSLLGEFGVASNLELILGLLLAIWVLHRIGKGWLWLVDGRVMYPQTVKA
jgi:uncharacterized membrane protein